MKKIVSILLAIIMLIGMIPFGTLAVSAEGNTEISVESVNAMLDSTAEVSVSITGNPGIASMGIILSFDSALTLIEAENGEAFSELTMTAPSQLKTEGAVTESCRFAWLGSDNATSDGVILKLRFRVSADAQVNTDCVVSVVCESAYDEGRESVQVSATAGAIRVLDYVPGDVDGSGVINMLDVLTLCQYYVDECRYNPNGYAVDINALSGDVDGNGMINMLDVLMVCQYYVDDCTTNPNGYNVTLRPGKVICSHNMQFTAAEEPTCTEYGNYAYWTCLVCGKYFSDENASNEISLTETIIAATGHSYATQWSYDESYHWYAASCEHSTLVKDKEEHMFGTGNICSICQFANTPDPTKPYQITYRLYEYNVNKGDTYISSAHIDNSENPSYYSSTDSFELESPKCDGYEFLGWFKADGTQVTSIVAGTNTNLTLYAHWNALTYDIVYRLFKTPIEDNIEDQYKSYTINKGLVDLPNPDIYNYIFLGWYTDDGVEVTNIPVGTYGDIALNAYFVSKRNLAQPVNKLGDPIIIENADEGVIYFAYELGAIKNVPLDTLWKVDSVVGLEQQISKEYTWSVSSEHLKAISDTISKSTEDSGTWSLSENWSDVLNVSESWAEAHNMSTSEAKEAIKTSADGYSLTYSNGGQSSTTETDGTTTLDYNSRNTTGLESVETKVEAGLTASTEVNAGFMKGDWEVSVSGGVDRKNSTETNKHTGTDTTTVNTTVKNDSSSWNNSSSSEHTNSLSTKEAITNALSEVISNTKEYGQSYAMGGEGSQSFGISSSTSKNSTASSTFTYTTAEGQKTTETIKTSGKTDGSYRQTVAGTIHVFGIVGYDVASKTYFHYTYNVMDDKVDLFLDYSPDGCFNDYEYSVLPFEIPYFVNEYVSSKVAVTENIEYKIDSTTKTATIHQYNGKSTDVLIPTYISAGGTAYKVTGISATVFAGKTSIKNVILSEYIDEIPDGAFKGCTSLKGISGFYTKIGKEAFSGCCHLEEFTISSYVSEIGEDAFLGVPKINITALNADRAVKIATEATDPDITAQALTQDLVTAAINSGADMVTLDISGIVTGTELDIDVPQISYFELNGGEKTYTNLVIDSNAKKTKFSELIINNTSNSSITIASENVEFNAVSAVSKGTTLVLPWDGAKIDLYKDTRLTSESGTAIVCINAVFTSQKMDDAIGTLDVSGNVYVVGENGNVTEKSCPSVVTVTNGKIIAIDSTQFGSYSKGTFTITFNANDGTVSQTAKTVIYGSAYGTLPTPTKTGYTFEGWYTKDGTLITAETLVSISADQELIAKWTATTYTITFNATGGTVSQSYKQVYFGSKYGTLPTPTRTGFKFKGWYTAASGGTEATSETTMSTVGDITLYAQWYIRAYIVTWSVPTGATITVKRISSPYGGKKAETLSSGDVVCYGDVLSITYAATTGYTLKSNGKTSITVTGDVTASDINATVTPNNYTYNVVYKSSNGTSLGSTTVTKAYNTTNTITPKAFEGYDTPASQNVKWDSTSAKTITFTYIPTVVEFTTKSGSGIMCYVFNGGSSYVSYDAVIEYRNRTADSVQIRVNWDVCYQYCHGISSKISAGGVSTTTVITPYLADGHDMKHYTNSTDWITVPISTTQSTNINLDVRLWQTNWPGDDITASHRQDFSATWSVAIPAY